jgi:hypothetical protein
LIGDEDRWLDILKIDGVEIIMISCRLGAQRFGTSDICPYPSKEER